MKALCFSLVFLFLISTVAAAEGSELNSIADSVLEKIGSLFTEKEIATRTLFTILLFMLFYFITGFIFKNKWYVKIPASAIVAILSIWWIPDSVISSMREEYGAFGVVLLSVLLFAAILAITIKIESDLIGRVLWLFYFLYYMAVLIHAVVIQKTGWFSIQNIPYFAAIIAGLILFLFIPAVRNAVFKGKLKEIKEEGAKTSARAKLLHSIEARELEELYGGKK